MKKQMMKVMNKGILLSIISLALISCGKSNKSGSSSSTTPTTGTITTLPGGQTYTGGNGTVLPTNWLDVIANENKCFEGGSRIKKTISLANTSVNANALYVGVTSYGDIAIVSSSGAQPTIDMYFCPRAQMTGQGNLINDPVINYSPNCPMGEISGGAKVVLQGPQNVTYKLQFRPAHIPNAGIRSSLCK